jgi:hypothetical protein
VAAQEALEMVKALLGLADVEVVRLVLMAIIREQVKLKANKLNQQEFNNLVFRVEVIILREIHRSREEGAVLLKEVILKLFPLVVTEINIVNMLLMQEQLLRDTLVAVEVFKGMLKEQQAKEALEEALTGDIRQYQLLGNLVLFLPPLIQEGEVMEHITQTKV